MASGEALARLSHADPGVRRIAVLDVAASRDAHPQLAARLAVECDERTAILIARALGAHAGPEAMRILWRLYEDQATPVRIAHAAILAHDTIQRRTQTEVNAAK